MSCPGSLDIVDLPVPSEQSRLDVPDTAGEDSDQIDALPLF
ncbi:hypothetical protein ACFVGX_23515 [Streptomyces sp. NPDC127113]